MVSAANVQTGYFVLTLYSDSNCAKVSEIQAIQLGVCNQQDTKSGFILTATKTTTNGQPVVSFSYSIYKSPTCDASYLTYSSAGAYDTTLVCLDVNGKGDMY